MGTALGLALRLGFGGYKVPAWLKAWKTYSDTSLTATPASDTAMDLAWTNPVISGVTLKNVVVEISTDGVAFTTSATLGAVTSTQVTGLTAGTLYYYRLKFVSSRNITTSAGTSVGARTIDYVDYIQSSGTQYIDTQTVYSGVGLIECEFQFYGIAASENIAGGYLGPSNTLRFDFSSYFIAGGVTYTIFPTKIERGTISGYFIDWQKIEINNRNGILIRNQTTYTATCSLVTTGNIYLFGRNANGTFTVGSNCKIKYYKHSTLANYKPCLNTLGQFCMFDEVSKTYKTNAGTGYFKGGGVTSAMIDARLIQYAAAGVSGVTIDFTGDDNGTRSSASDAAVAALTTAGCTILVNP